MSAARSVDDYLASQPESARRVLQRVRAAIRKAIPGAEEVISYSMPAYRVEGRIALYLAGWTAHYSIYAASARLVAAFGAELAPYELSKGTIRFPYTGRIPVGLIARIAKFRAKETAERVRAKAVAQARPRAARRPRR